MIFLDNVAFCAEISLSPDQRVVKVHAQALVLEGKTVEEVIHGDEPEQYQYLRADFDPKNLGRLFPDPIVHVHAAPKHEPRFPLTVSNTVPHVDFIELLLRNYARNKPDTWGEWADRVWERRIQPSLGSADDRRVMIRAAFRDNQYELLYGDLRDSVLRWKDVLRNEKRRMSALTYDERFAHLDY